MIVNELIIVQPCHVCFEFVTKKLYVDRQFGKNVVFVCYCLNIYWFAVYEYFVSQYTNFVNIQFEAYKLLLFILIIVSTVFL